MTKDGKTDELSEATGAHDVSSADAAEETSQVKVPDAYLSHQDGLNVPEPAYFRHLKDSADQIQIEHADGFESDDLDGRWSSPPSTPDPLAAEKRERSRRFRFWIYIALIVLIYVVFRTVDLMH